MQEAYVDGLAGMALFDAMFEEDKDAQCFRLMPEVPVLLERLVRATDPSDCLVLALLNRCDLVLLVMLPNLQSYVRN